VIIRVERSGGFAGMTQRSEIDAQQLDPPERQELEQLVETSGILAADRGPSPGPGSSDPRTVGADPKTVGADQFQYRITIEHSGQSRTVELDEGSIPAEWRALVQRINDLARRFRGK
jgi:hypothetical protein